MSEEFETFLQENGDSHEINLLRDQLVAKLFP